MNRCHIYGIALLLLVSFDMHATTDQQTQSNSLDNSVQRVVTLCNGYVNDLRSGAKRFNGLKKRIVGKSEAVKNLAIHVVSRHDLVRALATTCSGKYSLAPDNIALLCSTFLVDGGMHTYNKVQEHNNESGSGSVYDGHIFEDAESDRKVGLEYKQIAKEIALKTAKDCAKTAAAIVLQEGAIWAIKNCGFSKFLKDLSKSKHLIKPAAFVLVRTAIDSCVEGSTTKARSLYTESN